MNDQQIPDLRYMVPDPDKLIEHGQQPTAYVRPSKPPTSVPNGGVGNAGRNATDDAADS